MEGSSHQNGNEFEGYDEDYDRMPGLIESQDESLMDFLKREIAEMDQSRVRSGRRLDYLDLNKSDASNDQEASGSGSTSNANTDENVGINSPERASDLLLVMSFSAEPMRSSIIELSGSAMEELKKLVVSGDIFWQRLEGKEKYETLNGVQYMRHFGDVDKTLKQIIKMVEIGEPEYLPFFDSRPIESDLKLKATPAEAYDVEASRDFAYLRMNPIDIAEWFMDVEKWSDVFFNIVSRATMLGILIDGVEGSLDGRLQVMSGEFQMATALVRTRVLFCQILPSGCFIQFMPHHGYSKITWVEHVEADNRELNLTFRNLIKSGFAFGATRWVSALVRQYEYSQTLKEKYAPPEDTLKTIPETGRMGMLKLGERMIRTFCTEISGVLRNQWNRLPSSSKDSEDVRVAIREHVAEPGQPSATSIVFSTSQRFRIAPRRLFDFLRNGRYRSMWDMLARGLCVQELSYIVKGKDPANRVSLMQVTDDEGTDVIHYIQESYTDKSGSYVVYAPVDEPAVTALLEGADPDMVGILPSGFAIVPDDIPKDDGPHSILTASFHIVYNYSTKSHDVPPRSLLVVKRILRDTLKAVKSFVINA
ncbi:hypothetical protein K1719_034994 [Acacia pycnantha]|nr:hypothetical protein K1719_034994 [Acacia pycnantha]